MEEIMFWLGQIFGAIAVILGIINYQLKTREQFLIVHITTTIVFSLQYFCLGAWAGMAMNMVGCLRNIVFYFVGKGGKYNRVCAIFFSLLMCGMGLYASLSAGEDWYFILSVIGLTVNSYSMSFRNPNYIKISILFTSPIVLLYDAFASAYGAMIYESVIIISTIVFFIRTRKNKT